MLETSDVTASTVLERIWNLLDDVFEKLAHQRLDDVLQHWETAHRLPGQLVADWCTHVPLCRLDVHVQGETVISDAAIAIKMLRVVGLHQASRAEVLYNAGGKYETERIESCFRNTFGQYHKHERKLGLDPTPSYRNRRDQRDQRGRVQPREGSRVMGRFGRGGKFAGSRKTHVQEHVVNDNEVYLEEQEDSEDEQHSEYDSHLTADNVTGPQVYLENGDDQS